MLPSSYHDARHLKICISEPTLQRILFFCAQLPSLPPGGSARVHACRPLPAVAMSKACMGWAHVSFPPMVPFFRISFHISASPDNIILKLFSALSPRHNQLEALSANTVRLRPV